MPASADPIVSRIRRPGLRRLLVLGVALIVAIVGVRAALPPVVPTIPALRTELVQTVVATGRVRSLSRAQLGTAISGIVRQVMVREGTLVEANQPLVLLEDDEAQAQVAQARAALQRAEAARAALDDVERTTARARAKAAQAAFETAERHFERVRRLVEAGARAGQDADAARDNLEAARAARDIAVAELTARSDDGTGVRMAEAVVAEARAGLLAAQARLAHTRIEAPGPGRVLTRSVEPGDAVQPGRVLLTLSLDGPTQLVAVPDEKDVARLAVGQEALASADAYPEQSFPARVSFVAPAVDPGQGTIETRLDVDSAPAYLRPDMTVSIQIETARRARALVIPVGVVQDATTRKPWVLAVRGGRLERLNLTLGLRGDEYVEVRSGLDEGDAVVLPPYQGRGPGDRVRVGR
ncbi:MAG: efflux RND transporter periplasmic adaptor subunit [Gemmatimonadales bacterium]